MWKANKYSTLPDIVKAAIEEMVRLVVTLNTLPLPSETVNQLKKVKEKLERVRKEYPQLRWDFEEDVYEEFKEEEKHTPANDNQTDIYEPVLEQERQTTPTTPQIKWDKKILDSACEQQKEKTPFRPPREPPTVAKKVSRPLPTMKGQQCPSESRSPAYREPDQSSVSDYPVANYEDPAAALSILRTPYSDSATRQNLNKRGTLFPHDLWFPPVDDSLLKEHIGDSVDRSKASIPIPPPFIPSATSSATSRQHKDPPKKRDSIRLFPKNTQSKGGNEKSGCYCVAQWNCDADADNELSFKRGDRMRIVDRQYEDKGWLVVELKEKTGLAPANYVLTDST